MTKLKISGFIFFLFSITSYCITFPVNGTVKYWNDETQSYQPLVNAEISVDGFTVYTNSNGYYVKELSASSLPDQITVIIFFRNQQVDLRGVQTTRSFSHVQLIFGSGDPCPSGIPCDFHLGDDFTNMDVTFTATQQESRFAKIFMLANKAAEFTQNNGYTPPRVIVKYPAETSLINTVNLEITSSFFWPYETISNTNFFGQWFTLYNIFGILNFLDLTGEITENAIYITQNEAIGKSSTVFHEYGHFLMKAKIGQWTVSQSEYLARDVPFSHSWNDIEQNERLAYLEGWADFFGSAVQSWVDNPSSPYSGSYSNYSNIFENPWQYLNKPNGYKHEVLVGAAFFDFYDTESGDDAFNTSFLNILNTLGSWHLYMKDYINALAHQSYFSDQTRNAGIAIMNNLNMDPYLAYGNATLNVKNQFVGGNVNIDYVDYNTNASGGKITQTPLIQVHK